MDSKEFERKLTDMSKPAIGDLKHQQILESAIIRARDKYALSWWWLIIPLYVLAALVMKSAFMPSTTLHDSIRDFMGHNSLLAVALVYIAPSVFILVNFLGIRRIYYLLGKPRTGQLLPVVWRNVLAIIICLLILLIYSLK